MSSGLVLREWIGDGLGRNLELRRLSITARVRPRSPSRGLPGGLDAADDNRPLAFGMFFENGITCVLVHK